MENNYASEICCLKTTSKYDPYIRIVENYDTFILDAIKIPIEYDLDLCLYLTICIETIHQQKIPFQLLRELGRTKKTSDSVLIVIPKEVLYKEANLGIPLYKIRAQVGIKLETKNGYIDFAVYIKGFILAPTYKKQYLPTYIMNEYHEHKFENTKQLMLQKVDACYSGMFIFGTKKLNQISMTMHGCTRFSYDNEMIDYVGTVSHKSYKFDHNALADTLFGTIPADLFNDIKRYTTIKEEYVYWIPFDPCARWTDNIQSYIDGKKNSIFIGFGSAGYTGTMYLMSHTMLDV